MLWKNNRVEKVREGNRDNVQLEILNEATRSAVTEKVPFE